MTKIKQSLSLLLFISSSQIVKGQGCSDAGFCTINSFKPSVIDSIGTNKANQVILGISIGKAAHSVSILSTNLSYNRLLSKKIVVDAKLSFISQNGNNIRSTGLSDLYLNTIYSISNETKLTVGTKIPLKDGNMKNNAGSALPMDYQPSLGTWDIILGIGHEYKKMKFVLALQQPLSQNKNQFLAENFPPNSLMRQFQSTNKYTRSGDILLRVSYPFSLNKKMTISPSVLPVYHLKDDNFTDINGMKKSISGSQGLTLNGNIYFDYVINRTSSIDLNFGMPLISRQSRPDGLTRKYICTLEYKVDF